MTGESLAAWLLLPAVVYILGAGLALLLERVTRVTLPDALLAPVGVCAAICLAMPGFSLGFGGGVAAVVVGVPALAGLVAGRERLAARLTGGWAGLAGVAVYLLYLAPVLLDGSWTWTGYNFVNDTAVQLLLADQLAHDGTQVSETARSTTSIVLTGYLENDYPVGTHGLLALLGVLVPAPLEALYQPLIAALAALAAMALAALGGRAGLPAPVAALAAAVALGANLTYQYALQGNVKEIGMLMTLAAAAAAGRELLAVDRPIRAAPAVLLACVAGLLVFSAAAVPYIAALAAALLVAAFIQRGLQIRVPTRKVALVGAAAVAAVVLPLLPTVVAFGETSANAFAGARKIDAGQLLRPLDPLQIAGIWPTADYRLPVPDSRQALTVVACLAVFALCAAGVVTLLRRRETGPLLVLLPGALTLAVLSPLVSSYAQGKTMAIVAPAVVLVAGVGLLALARLSRPPAYAIAILLIGGILLSNAYAYHDVRLAPIDRMESLEDLNDRYAGKGLVLFNEFEEFAKYFMRDASINVPTERVTQRAIELREPEPFINHYFDLDEQRLAFIQSYPYVAQRRGPAASRPPASYVLDYENEHYRVWRRTDDVLVRGHMPLQGVHSAVARAPCREVRRLASRARPGEVLVAARRPETVLLDTFHAFHSPGWTQHPFEPETLVPATPGRAVQTVDVEAGRYRAWVRGSFSRPIEVQVDGRTIGSAAAVETPGSWIEVATVELAGGRHDLSLVRGGGRLAPGDGFADQLGPLALERVDGGSLVRVAPRDAGRLCGGSFDWLEIVSG